MCKGCQQLLTVSGLAGTLKGGRIPSQLPRCAGRFLPAELPAGSLHSSGLRACRAVAMPAEDRGPRKTGPVVRKRVSEQIRKSANEVERKQ